MLNTAFVIIKSMQNENHELFMLLAIEEAKRGKAHGDWPFGAVVVQNGIVVGKGYAMDKTTGDVTDHAEIIALRGACRELKINNLENCTIYCSNEPCLMCAASIFQANISHVIIGASREDLAHLLRPRKIHIDSLAQDSGRPIEIIKGVLKENVLELFKDVKKS